MKLTLEETVQLRSGDRCVVRIAYEGEATDVAELVREVGVALLEDDAPRREPSEAVRTAAEAAVDRGAQDLVGDGDGSNGHETGGAEPGMKLHGKAKNTVHKVVLALDQRAGRGTPATVDDIERGTGLSRPAIYRVLDQDTPQGRYARGLIRVEREGNAYAIDITSAGRNMASRLRTRPL